MKTVAVAVLYPGAANRLEGLCALAAGLSEQSELWLVGQLPEGWSLQLPVTTVRQVEASFASIPDAAAVLAALQPLLTQQLPRLLLFDDSHLGYEIATRLAVRLQGKSLGGVTAVTPAQGGWTVQRPLYSCNLMGEYLMGGETVCLSIASDSLPEAVLCNEAPPILRVQPPPYTAPSGYQLLSLQEPEESGSRLERATAVLAMGRGCRDAATREGIRKLALRMGAELGATRSAALDGYLELSGMLGISGVSVAPLLTIAFGVSGATPFVMGVRKSKCLVAVNSDPNALIFGVCDYGIVDSCEAVVEELLLQLQEVQK